MRKRSHFTMAVTVTSLLVVFACSEIGRTSEFSADLEITGQMMSGKGKVWVKGNKMRQEYDQQMGGIVTIMDLDRKTSWILMPESKTYMVNVFEYDGGGFSPENFVSKQQGFLISEAKKIGTEKVNGYVCDKYIITFEGELDMTMTQWFAKKLNYPIKMESTGAMMGQSGSELINIKPGGVKDSVFDLPPGYSEMKIPAISQDMLKGLGDKFKQMGR